MEFRTIRQTSHISGENRNPGILENNKSLVWDNTSQKFKYILYTNLGANTKVNDGYVYNGNSSEAGEYIWKLDINKNPLWRKEEYLKTISKATTGNYANFIMNNGSTKVLQLGALAWLDSITIPLSLPGDTKVLFDDNNTIGGDSSVTFDKTNKLLNLTGFTGIQVKNNADAVYKGVLQYFGNKNLVLGHGVTRSISWGSTLVDNILIGDNAGGSLITGQNNVIIGHLAGSNVANNVQGSIYVGNYAGRLETSNNRFYLGNVNYTTLAEAKLGSLLYGEIDNGLLRVNDRLEIKNEVKVGSFNILNTPTWGMLQFIGTGNVNEYKPQYYDGFVWQNFASGANYYLNTVTKATPDVGTVLDAFKLTFDMIGIPDFTLQLGANAFNSTIIPQASVDTVGGIIQISSGNNSDSNRGFSSNSGLLWNNGSTELNIPGGIKLSTKSRYTTSGNVIISDGVHFYGRIGVNWIQLDNETTTGQSNILRYDGSVTGFDLSLPKDGLYLPIKGIKSDDNRIIIVDNLVANDLDLSLDLSIGGFNYPIVTTTLTSANIFSIVDNAISINPTIKLRSLISSDNSVRFITTINNEIDISATGTGNPNVYQLSNEGTGVAIKDVANSTLTDWKLKSLYPGANVSIVSNPLDLTFNVSPLTLNNSNTSNYILSIGANTFDLTQKQLISGSAITITDSLGLTFSVNKAIPKITWNASPSWTPLTGLGQGTISANVSFSSDIRTSPTLYQNSIFSLNIGNGLFYDPITNTLKSLSSAGSPTDYRVTSGDRNYNALRLYLTDGYGGGAPQVVNIDMGRLAWENDVVIPIAKYTDSVGAGYGGVMINKSIKLAPLGNKNSFV